MYEKYMKKSMECLAKAMATNDLLLKIFYFNAHKGYEEKALNLTVGDA